MSLSQSIEYGSTSDVESAARVFLEHGEFIRTVIRYRAQSEAEVDDLFHDLFLSLASRPIPANVQNIKGYLYRMVANDITDSRRRINVYQTALRKHYQYSIGSDVDGGPESALIDVEETVKLFGMVEKRLSTAEARAVTLRYRDNYSTEETAREMKVKPRTVSRYLSVGLSKLREFLSQVGEDYNDKPRT